jgi:ZIP family zinc transporter
MIALPMRAGGLRLRKAFGYALLSGIPTGIGALIGAALGEISPAVIALCLGFAGGAMLYVVCGDLVPRSKSLYRGRFPVFGGLLGFGLGLLISLL